ncbi:MAG: MFS transporter [Gammaproteobacteria bacterium]|nr:MAG: MFS transporter [Gammaproteobacteria bacterium]
MAEQRRRSLVIISLCQVAAMAMWFSASAIVPALKEQIGLDPFRATLFTSTVQLGFVVGTLCSALLGLADRLESRRFFMCSALTAATANTFIVFLDPASNSVLILRFITGIAMAGIYPIGMRLTISWARNDAGLLMGMMVGALTLGSAAPHFFSFLGDIDWRYTLGAASVSGVIAGLGIQLANIGPGVSRKVSFGIGEARRALSAPGLRLANLGYLGHMWELYAMWAWIGLFFHESFQLAQYSDEQAASLAALATFAVIGVGAAGCGLGGYMADRVGRTTVTIGAMLVSGSCALIVGHLSGSALWILLTISLIWGFSIVADSAQFSASIAELSEPTLVGTMLTTQTCLGFLVTLLTIHLIPPIVAGVGWGWGFSFLAIGPLVGVAAMWRLRQHPDAQKLAGGKR